MFSKTVFKESKRFSDEVVHLLTDFEFSAFQRALALDPGKGEMIQSAGGARKIRVALSGRGKRGGGRVVYFYQVGGVIHLLLIYSKSVQEDLAPEELKWVREAVRTIKEGRL